MTKEDRYYAEMVVRAVSWGLTALCEGCHVSRNRRMWLVDVLGDFVHELENLPDPAASERGQGSE